MTATATPTLANDAGMNKIIHAAFRRDLARFDEAFAAFPTHSRKRAAQLVAAWDHFAYQLHAHHQDEETLFWPAFSELGVDASLVGDLHGEHGVMLGALEAAEVAVDTFGADPSPANASAARQAIGTLRTVLLEHLSHEEADMDPFADSHLSTREFKAAQKGSRKAHTEGAGAFFAWLLRQRHP